MDWELLVHMLSWVTLFFVQVLKMNKLPCVLLKIISKSHDHSVYVDFTCSRSSISNSIPTEVLLLQSQKYSSNN